MGGLSGDRKIGEGSPESGNSLEIMEGRAPSCREDVNCEKAPDPPERTSQLTVIS